jgi:eukaryotic-like serine/threonine-protein kinase
MSNSDALALARQAVSLGLVTQSQTAEAWTELGGEGGDPDEFMRVMERKGYLTPWQSRKLSNRDTDGFFLGGYRILYKVASGSFGRVFRAEDPETKRIVAIKVLRRRWSDDQQRIDLFEREGRVGLSLRHSGIVEILTVNRDEPTGQWYIVMEFVEGGNLRDILAIRKKLEPAESLKLIEDAASGLAHAYARGVTHRDVKLTNILISTAGQAKLVDFGLAKFYATISKEEDKVERTVDYAGLERATGVKTGDVRSDIYFLGCVLYEVLTGRAPLETTRNKLARMHKQRFDKVPPISRAEVDAPPSLFHLVETMMSLNPQERYQTPAQLVDAIRATRRDLEGKNLGNTPAATERSVFVAESDERLQDAIRDKLKELGYRVYMAADPVRALDRFRLQPYDALVVDAGTTGEDGFRVFDRVMSEAERQKLSCAGILVLNRDQADWKERVRVRPRLTILVRPVTLKELGREVRNLVPADA